MNFLENIIGDVVGEIFVKVIWRGMIVPFFQYSGVGLRMVLNFHGKTKEKIALNKSYNAFLGVLFWSIVILIIIIVYIK
jgi:succinate dehydrogenase/fumarate reductase cytochrome b subunit